MTPKAGRCRDQQVTADRSSAGRDTKLELIKVFEGDPAAREKLLSEFSEFEATRRTVHQLDPEALLEGAESAPHDHRGHPFRQGGSREPALFGDKNKTAQLRVTVHIPSSLVRAACLNKWAGVLTALPVDTTSIERAAVPRHSDSLLECIEWRPED